MDRTGGTREMRSSYKILLGNLPEWKRPLGIPWCRCEDNSEMDFIEIWLTVLIWLKTGSSKGLLSTR